MRKAPGWASRTAERGGHDRLPVSRRRDSFFLRCAHPLTAPRRGRGPRKRDSDEPRSVVDPWGDLHAVSARGLFTGNRGCIVDKHEQVVRHHRSSTLWITCLTEFRDWRVPLARPNRWTPIFFLDDAVALAAGHRPYATCRCEMYRSYRDAVDPALRAV